MCLLNRDHISPKTSNIFFLSWVHFQGVRRVEQKIISVVLVGFNMQSFFSTMYCIGVKILLSFHGQISGLLSSFTSEKDKLANMIIASFMGLQKLCLWYFIKEILISGLENYITSHSVLIYYLPLLISAMHTMLQKIKSGNYGSLMLTLKFKQHINFCINGNDVKLRIYCIYS